ncbi:hypothetical protein AMR41_08140 [Hapalosiphon sp. MRB220]|nr:hypothetical protein AMR41_08140 [Hapalosiphon sp. MRB220]
MKHDLHTRKAKDTSASPVTDVLTRNGIRYDLRELPASARSAEEAAHAVGASLDQIAKSLVFKDTNRGDAVLLIVSGSNRVNIDKLADSHGLTLAKANAAFVKDQTGFSIGSVPAFGHAQKLRTYIDQDLKRHETAWVGAGTDHGVLLVNTADLQRLTDGEFVDLADHTEPSHE